MDTLLQRRVCSLKVVERSALKLPKYIRLEDTGEKKNNETMLLLFTVYLAACMSRSSALLSLAAV